jgi:arsenate reductase
LTKDAQTMQAQHALMLKGIANRLEGEFGTLFTRDTLQHYVDDSYNELAARATVQTLLPALVERFATHRLSALAKTNGSIDADHLDILFVCERNDAISQMAAAMFNATANAQARAHSAGTAPAGELLEEAAHVLREIDIDLVDAFPKPITTEIEQAADLIITLDAHDSITIIDGKRYLAWRLADHHAQGLDGYRAMRDELKVQIHVLVEEAAPHATAISRPTGLVLDEDASQLTNPSDV